jgi:hypothetical protein
MLNSLSASNSVADWPTFLNAAAERSSALAPPRFWGEQLGGSGWQSQKHAVGASDDVFQINTAFQAWDQCR